MEATCSSESPIDFQRPTRRYIPKDISLHNHRCENLKFYSYAITIQSTAFNLFIYRAVSSSEYIVSNGGIQINNEL
jgi:hypothetical protein